MTTDEFIENYWLEQLSGEHEEVKRIVNDWRKGYHIYSIDYKKKVNGNYLKTAKDIIMEGISNGLG